MNFYFKIDESVLLATNGNYLLTVDSAKSHKDNYAIQSNNEKFRPFSNIYQANDMLNMDSNEDDIVCNPNFATKFDDEDDQSLLPSDIIEYNEDVSDYFQHEKSNNPFGDHENHSKMLNFNTNDLINNNFYSKNQQMYLILKLNHT